MRLEFNLNRSAKAAAMVVALALSIYAYNELNWANFMLLQAVCMVLILGRIFFEDLKDPVLRIISGTYFLCSINNLYDETLGDPIHFKLTEKMFAAGLLISIIYAIIRVRNGRTGKH